MAQPQTRPHSKAGRRPGSPASKSRRGFTFVIRCRQRPHIAWRRMSCERNMATVTPIDLHYRVDGPSGAPVLVLSHALGLSMAMWDPQLDSLARTFRVIRYDHRGHGGSPMPAGPYRIEDLGRDLIQLLDRLAIGRMSFCGLSLGGMVGLWLAANAPERVDQLIVCCTAARMPRPEDYSARATLVRAQGMGAIGDTVIGRWFTPAFQARRPDDVAGTTASTLVIAGAEDQSTPPERGQEIAGRIRGARFVIIRGAAHLANVEQPESVTNRILGQLQAPAPRMDRPPNGP